MIYFRADANAQTGAGHMMRCLTIAQALRVQGDGSFVPGIRFLCADEDSAALPVSRGFQTHVLHTDYRNMESELSLLSTILTGEREEADGESGEPGSGPALFVDSYHVTDAYLATLRAFARVILIDDNMERAYPADVILNYNFHADAGAYRLLYASGTRLLIGPRYAPVRAQFADRSYRVRERVAHILILAGGSDPLNAAGAVYRTLREMTNNIPNTNKRNNENDIPSMSERNNDMPVPAFTLVCGRYSEHAPELDALAKEDGNLRVLHDVEDMASLMCESDLCISACGSTLYELCAIGLPFVCFALADNQMKLAAFLDANGPAPYAGAFHEDAGKTLAVIREKTLDLMRDYAARVSLSEKQKKLVDGRGASRIVSGWREP